MKLITFISCLLAFSLSGFCQIAASQPPVLTPDEIIQDALRYHGLDGHLEKLVPKWGDAAAVSITRVIADKEMDENDVRMVLSILQMAFRDPNNVENEADREPRTTLFVLRYLDRCTRDSGLKKEIAETKQYVQQQYAKYKAGMQK
jgi:hypothetical protein